MGSGGAPRPSGSRRRVGRAPPRRPEMERPLYSPASAQGLLFNGQVLARAESRTASRSSGSPPTGRKCAAGTASCTVIIGDGPIGRLSWMRSMRRWHEPAFAAQVRVAGRRRRPPRGQHVVIGRETSARADVDEMRLACTELAARVATTSSKHRGLGGAGGTARLGHARIGPGRPSRDGQQEAPRRRRADLGVFEAGLESGPVGVAGKPEATQNRNRAPAKSRFRVTAAMRAWPRG